MNLFMIGSIRTMPMITNTACWSIGHQGPRMMDAIHKSKDQTISSGILPKAKRREVAQWCFHVQGYGRTIRIFPL